MQLKHQEEINQFRITYSRAGSLTAALLVISGHGLDYFIYPNQFLPFLGIRILITILTIATFFYLGTQNGSGHVKSLTFFWLFLPQIMICWMINCTEGVHSIYFIGLNLAIYAIGVFLPLSVVEGLLFNTITVFLYVMACYFHASFEDAKALVFGNSLFLILSTGAATVTTYFNEQQRNKLFTLQDEIENKNLSLEQSNRNLAEIKGHMIQQEKMSALGTLSAGLLHELNNPVNYSMMAIGMAELEPEINSNTMLKESLADAKEGMTRVRDIVMDLKTFAYQKPGEDTSRVFLFENAVRSALRLSGFELKDITVEQELPIDTHVLGDEPAMIGVLINLVTNAALALKKSEHNEPTLHIKAWRAASLKNVSQRLYVTVRDNGTGIKPENLTRVFEPFFTTRDVGHGLGLGLAVSYAIIQRHGSELTVTSSLGEWTQFAFDLPVGNNA